MEDKFFISQESYTKEILKKFNMIDCNPENTPMESGTKLSKFDKGEKVNPIFLKSLVRSLRYLTFTRPNILFAVGVVSHIMEVPTSTHLKVARRILRYLNGTIDFGLFIILLQVTSTLWGIVIVIMREILMIKKAQLILYFLGDSVISWSSKKQSVVTLSTCETEYIAATSCACHAIC